MYRKVLYLAFAGVAAGIVAYVALKPSGQKHMTGAALAEVKVPQLSSEQMAGEMAFNENCASCHGTNAAGQEGIAPPLVHFIYEPSHHGDQAFVLAVQNGVRQHHWPFGNMPPVEDVSEGEIQTIIAYVRALQRANGIN